MLHTNISSFCRKHADLMACVCVCARACVYMACVRMRAPNHENGISNKVSIVFILRACHSNITSKLTDACERVNSFTHSCSFSSLTHSFSHTLPLPLSNSLSLVCECVRTRGQNLIWVHLFCEKKFKNEERLKPAHWFSFYEQPLQYSSIFFIQVSHYQF
jgi:hypothetical protein